MMLCIYFALSLAAVTLPLSVWAEQHSNRYLSRHHHREVVVRPRGDIQLHRRFDDTRWTFYDAGLGACGETNSAGDFIVALNVAQFGSGYPGPHCFKTITMTYNGKTTQARITDLCPGCPFGGLDLTRGLFNFFANEGMGVIQGSWTFNEGNSGGGGAPRPSPTPEPTPSPTTTTAPLDVPPSSSTRRRTSTSTSSPLSSSSSVLSSSAAESSSSIPSILVDALTVSSASFSSTAESISLPTATGIIGSTSQNAHNLQSLGQVLLSYGALVVAAVES